MGKFNDRIEAEFDPPRKWILSRALSYQWDYDADVDEDALKLIGLPVDQHEIVVDEVVGQMLPLLAIPIYETLYLLPREYYCVAAFLLFRLFDIWKPFPINYVDNNTKGALGIMLDDIMAAAYTVIILTILFFFLGA